MFEYDNLRYGQSDFFSRSTYSPLAQQLILKLREQRLTVEKELENYDMQTQSNKAYKECYEKYADEFALQIAKILSNHVGMWIRVAMPRVPKNYFVMPCIFFNYGKLATNIDNMVMGHYGYAECKGKKKDIEQITNILNSFDDETMTFKNFVETVPEKQRNEITPQMLMGFHDLYMAHITLKLKVEEIITEEEYASIILHELGHFLVEASKLGQIAYVSKVMGETKQIVSDALKDKDPLKALESVETRLKVLSEVTPETKEHPEVQKNLKLIRELKLKVKERKEPIHTYQWFFIRIAIIMLSYPIFIIEYLFIIPMGTINHAIIEMFDKHYLSFKTKTSDTYTTNTNIRQMEYGADAYVTRHGLSSPLMSSLKKLDHLIIFYGYDLANDTAAIRESRGIKRIAVFTHYISMIIIIPIRNFVVDNEVHGSYIKRLRDNRKSVVAMFKKIQDPKIEKSFIQDYEEITAMMKETEKAFHLTNAVGDWFINFHKYVIAFTTKGFNIFGQKSVRLFMEKNMNRIDEFINSKLFYQAAKIDLLGRKKR